MKGGLIVDLSMATQIHERALRAAHDFVKCQVEVIETLDMADQHRVYLKFECTSLFEYATKVLGYSEDVTCTFINLARKSREVPRLKDEIRAHRIGYSKANRLCSVLKKDNQDYWLNVASRVSKRQLEKLIAEANPKAAVIDRANYVAKDRIELQVGVSEKFMISLRRTQEILSQRRRRPVSLEEALDTAVTFFNDRHDPVSKAKRQLVKGKLSAAPLGNGFAEANMARPKKVSGPGRIDRAPIPAKVRHRLNIKFEGQCAHINSNGERCGQKKFLDIHHITPLSEGGTDDLGNLELLCSAHHRTRHS